MEEMVDLEHDRILCVGCGRSPEEIGEYINAALEEGYDSPTEFVICEEGTYNPVSNRFWCTWCYIKAGQPGGVAP